MASTTNAARCASVTSPIGCRTSASPRATTTSAAHGARAPHRRAGPAPRTENATMNVTRYSASGTTQSMGADTMSVARCAVTPSSSAEGTSASTNHVICCARRGPDAGRGSGTRVCARPAVMAQSPTAADAITKPTAHPADCSLRVAIGSTSAYVSRPTRLPALLAAYRKYGSRARGAPVCENHCCRSGVVADSAKNGRPAVVVRTRSVHHAGLESPGLPTSIGNGSITPAATSTLTWIATRHRRETAVVRTCA